MRVRLSRRANADMRAIRDYIAADNPRAAATMLRRLRDGMRRLALHPEVGSRRSEPGAEGLRFLVVRGYSVVYTIVSESEVLIARILGPGQTLLGD